MFSLNKKIMLVLLLLIFALPGVNYPALQNLESTPLNTSSLSESFGAAIIVAGDRSDHELQAQIRYGASKVYDILVNVRGFLASRVYYLSPNNPGGLEPNADAVSTKVNIQYAFTNWVNDKVDSTHGLVVYLFDHGGSNGMAIPGDTLWDTEVDTWLDALATNQQVSRIVIVYEACTAGSFISPLSQSNRIVITSTDASHSASASSDWAIFSESFWGSIAIGDTIGDAFISGWYNVVKTGHATSQYPLLDDDHNSVAHGPQVQMVWLLPVAYLPNSGDGNDALNTKITGYGGPLLIPNIKIWQVSPHIFVKFTDPTIPVSIQIANNTPVKNVKVKLIPPQWTPPPPRTNESMREDIGIIITNLTDTDGDGNYTGIIMGPTGALNLTRGEGMLAFYASSEYGIADAVYVPATANDDGLPPPDTTPPAVVIRIPINNTIVSGNVTISAIADDDQALNNVEIYVDNILVKNRTMPAYYPYPAVTYFLDTSLYQNGNHTILAKAFDKMGFSSTSMVMINIQNGPPISGFSFVIVFGVILAGIAWVASRRRFSDKTPKI